MLSIGITGGIGSGKTQFSRFLHALAGGTLFDADACVKKNLEENPAIADAIRHMFGKKILNDAGKPNREKLRNLVFQDESKRKKLESLLHPWVWNSYQEILSRSKKDNASILLADIPLIYETHSQERFDAVVTVACSLETQMERMIEIRRIPHALALQMLQSQIPMKRKTALADHVAWNDGSLEILKTQAEIFAKHLLGT